MSVSGDGKDNINTADIDQDGRNKSDDIGEEVQEPTVQDIAVESAARPKIEAPTTQNLEQYLNSLDNNTKPMGLEDVDRKLPPASDVVNESSSGFQSPIVPQFVHIPIDNKSATLATKHRAPSVPDLISYSHSHERNTATTTITTNNVPLSNEILPNKKDNRESRKEQFEERLRRAHLRLKSDATGDNNNEEVTRYRSRSTPSRHLRVDDNNNGEGTTDNRRSSLCNSFGHNTTSNGILLPPDTSELETSELAVHLSIESSAPEPISPTDQQEDVDISNIVVENTPNSMLVATNSSCKSSHGSRVSDEERNDNILEPPPPPPPATEKERLVERERQARLETERARRRQLALQRDRQSDVDDADDENNADLLLGDVSFDAGLDQQEMAPEFVGDNGVVLDLPISSADSSSSIPRPPIPPPPATEKERLVERERQARLETERARRRHLALQREREDTSPDDDNDEVHLGESDSIPPTSPQSDMNSREDGRPQSTRSGEGIDHDQAEVPNTEAEANLSYPMERFLDRVDDEGDPSRTLPVDIATEENNAEPSLPYTMELFLADNVAVSEQNESATDATRSDTNLAHEPNITAVVDGTSIQPSLLEDESHQNEPSQAATQSDMSVESINASTDNLPISEVDDMAQFNHQGDNQSAALSSSRLSMASSHDASHHTPHLTEAEIAHLNEVEHASIGNAAPNSVRDEPSEASVTGRAIDHAFSIATQPTAIESVTVTEVSDHRGSIIESDVIRVDGPNISVQNSSSGGASAASVAAMPSIASSSDDSSHVSDNTPEGSHDDIGMPRLTEAGIGTLVDIENASLGPAPPQSVRDERLSESSVAERGEHQFSSTDPITEISSVDERDLLMMDNSDDDDSISDDHSENASVEAMPSDQSDQSVETPRVYHGEHRMHIDSYDEEMIVYQPSIIGSSASIEALPSIDESATHDYGAFHSRSFSRNSVDQMDHQYDRDIESAPLLTPTRNEEQAQTLPPAEPHSATSQHATLTPTLIVGIGTGFAVGLGLGIGLGLVRGLG